MGRPAQWQRIFALREYPGFDGRALRLYCPSASAYLPSALLLPIGTVVVALRRGHSDVQPLYVGHVSRPAGPWRPLRARATTARAVFLEHQGA